MTFVLHVDAGRWRSHTQRTRDAVRKVVRQDEPGPRLGDIVPVTKGNGYGFGNGRLAVEAQRLGVDALAVGTPFEAVAALDRFAGDVVVLQPWDPRDATADGAWREITATAAYSRVIRTIASIEALHALAATAPVNGHGAAPRVLLEGLTSMRRFGLAEPELDALLADRMVRDALRNGRVRLHGLTLHLPLAQPLGPHVETLERGWHGSDLAPVLARAATGRSREAWSWCLTWIRALAALEDGGVPVPAEAAGLWVSHLDDGELGHLRSALPEVPIRLRVGTRLWLGDDDATAARGTVLAVHQAGKGRAVGYRQRRSPRDGMLVVIGGGTAHGVALAAPSPVASIRQRMVAAANGALEAAGRARSPFEWAGQRLWFAEPPHAQMSLLWLTEADVQRGLALGHQAPGAGEEWDCRVRHTTARFDRVLGLDD